MFSRLKDRFKEQVNKISKLYLGVVVFAILLIIVAIVFISGEKEQRADSIFNYPEEVAKLVTHVTSGYIRSSDPVRIRFSRMMVEEEEINKVVEEEFISLDPSVDGVLKWEDPQTLAFHPDEPFEMGSSYTGEVSLNGVFAKERDDTDIPPLKFKFEVATREISSLEADFTLVKDNDPKKLMYTGVLSFTEPVELKYVEKSVELRSRGEVIDLTWSASKDNRSFSFQSDVINRGDRRKKMTLTVEKDSLGISSDIQKTAYLEPVKEFKFVSAAAVTEGGKIGIRMEFSDDLDPKQDLSGLVSVEDMDDIKLKSQRKEILIFGDFEHGEEYSFTVNRGIRSKWGVQVKRKTVKKMKFEDIKPRILFSSGGVFLPSSNNQKILFRSVNIKRVRLDIKRVFENNLCQFLQTEKLDSAAERTDRFNSSYVNRVGLSMVAKWLDLGDKKNAWLQHEIDLNKLLKGKELGLYLVELSFQRKDMIFEFDKDRRGYGYYGDEYYSNPNSYGYVYKFGRISKPVIISDIGLTYKQGTNEHLILATNLVDSTPMGGVHVNLKTYQNQVIARGTTDGEGLAVIKATRDRVFYVEAEKDGQRSIIKLNEMGWNMSTFDVSGEVVERKSALRAFIYTERGVYRPGDEVNFSVIVRNNKNTFPENHPVTMVIYNPKNQKVSTVVNKTGTDGFYSFDFQTKPEDLTGNWEARFLLGSRTISHIFKVETVVPYRLKINVTPDKKAIVSPDDSVSLDILTTYLMGNPASKHSIKVFMNLTHTAKRFKKYPGFVFNNESIEFKSIRKNVFDGKLNDQGKARASVSLPSLGESPSALNTLIEVRVLEKGGRPVIKRLRIPVDPYSYYIGMEKPKFRYGYTEVGSPVKTRVICVDLKGNPMPGRSLTYKIYKNNTYWWWEYDNHRKFRLNYKSDSDTELVKEGSIVSGRVPATIEFTPPERGEYLVEVQPESESGHVAAYFFRAYYWGDASEAPKDAGVLQLKSDKKAYRPEDLAVLSFPTPSEGTVLVTVERANRILLNRVYKIEKAEKEYKVEISITEEMLPNAFATVSIIQPHSQTLNDRPIRIYGVIPLKVEKPETRQRLIVKVPEVLRPSKDFSVEIQTDDKKRTQFTVAVVDEGLLAITNFISPDAWTYFFKKLALGVLTYDLYSHVIDANKGDIYKRFAVGGGVSEDEYRKKQQTPGKARRFKPVSMFQGPVTTDVNGFARVDFKMPNYIGAVRIMVVSARGNSYGSIEKTVPVKTDLMILPTFPRVLGPRDKITVPVTVFATKENLKNVKVSIMTEGPIHVSGSRTKTVTFEQPGEKDVFFDLEALEAIGDSKIILKASSNGEKITKETEITVRPSSPRIYDSITKKCEQGKSVSIIIPDRGIRGSNNAVIHVARKHNLNLGRRLRWLIHYPYGCIEQTTSSVFPQLYLKEFMKTRDRDEKRIDRHINAAIKRLRKFQTAAGGFSYWPGGSSESVWGTNYAGHFLIEAKKLGYSVPPDMLSGWARYQRSRANTTRDNLVTRVYRLYLLALHGKPHMGAMNLIKENSLSEMTDTEKWMLAATYKLAGVEKVANTIQGQAGFAVKEYFESGGTYGSKPRDLAMILDVLTTFESWTKAEMLFEDIAEYVSSRNWYSTQTTGYMLLAMGKYIKATSNGMNDETPKISGYIKLPGGKKVPFESENLKYSYQLSRGFGEKIEVFIDKKTTIPLAHVILDWDGIPPRPDVKDEEKRLTLQVEWLNEDGSVIDPSKLEQGTTFWAHLNVGRSSSWLRTNLEELALVYLVPAGWEIENLRLSGEDLPEWTKRFKLKNAEYVDIRDDRIMWFFDLSSYDKKFDFLVKLNAVTAGEFTMPPSIFEAMYDNRYKARKAARQVKVRRKK